MKAARKGYSRCLELLLDAGANVNRQDWLGDTSLELAAGSGHDRCVELLLKAGADVNKRDGEGYTALMEAAYAAHCSTVKLLLDSGSDVKVRSKNTGEAALLLARGSNCMKLLLDAGADVNEPAVNGRTALMNAVRDGDVNSVKLLIDAGADVNATMCYRSVTTCYGVTALHHTAYFRVAMVRCNRRDKLECVRLLLRAGAKINMFDSRGNNALTWNFRYSKSSIEEQVLLLFAAGETLQLHQIRDTALLCPELTTADLNLANFCRKSIRNHLLQLDPHENLFVRVPRLGLPAALQRYLVYDTSLTSSKTSKNSSEDDDDDDDNYVTYHSNRLLLEYAFVKFEKPF